MMRRKLAPRLARSRKAPPCPLDLASVDHVLTTTRSVRRRLDLERPVEPEVIEECLRLAIQAPTGGNSQGWRWIVVTDAGLRMQLAELYRDIATPYLAAGLDDGEVVRAAAARRRLGEVPRRHPARGARST